jgi:hypothetical protein
MRRKLSSVEFQFQRTCYTLLSRIRLSHQFQFQINSGTLNRSDVWEDPPGGRHRSFTTPVPTLLSIRHLTFVTFSFERRDGKHRCDNRQFHRRVCEACSVNFRLVLLIELFRGR